MLRRTQLMLPEEDLVVLKRMARENNESLSSVVRNIIKKRTKTGVSQRKSGAQMLIDAAGWAERQKVTGPKDLSVNDEYLYGLVEK